MARFRCQLIAEFEALQLPTTLLLFFPPGIVSFPALALDAQQVFVQELGIQQIPKGLEVPADSPPAPALHDLGGTFPWHCIAEVLPQCRSARLYVVVYDILYSLGQSSY